MGEPLTDSSDTPNFETDIFSAKGRELFSHQVSVDEYLGSGKVRMGEIKEVFAQFSKGFYEASIPCELLTNKSTSLLTLKRFTKKPIYQLTLKYDGEDISSLLLFVNRSTRTIADNTFLTLPDEQLQYLTYPLLFPIAEAVSQVYVTEIGKEHYVRKVIPNNLYIYDGVQNNSVARFFASQGYKYGYSLIEDPNKGNTFQKLYKPGGTP